MSINTFNFKSENVRQLYFILLILFAACSQPQENAEANQALEDYQAYVTKAEELATVEPTDAELKAYEQETSDSLQWQQALDQQKQAYESRKQKVQDNRNAYDQATQREIDELDMRYQQAVRQKQNTYQEASYRYKLRNELLGMPVSADDMSNFTEENIATVHERFVSNISEKENLTQRDWNLIEGWWLALDDRRRSLEDRLSEDAKQKIAIAARQYAALRTEASPATVSN